MVRRHHGDLVFVSSDILRIPRPLMAAYMASKWGLEGLVRALQLELEGTGVRATIIQPGQTLTEMGTDWGPDTTAEVARRVGPLRRGPPQPLPPTAGGRRGGDGGGVDTPGHAICPLIEVQPEAPVTSDIPPGIPPDIHDTRTCRRHTMTVDVGLREPPQVSGGEGEHGHLDELRVDPIALMRRVREECGDVGQFRLADRDVVLLTGAEANELFFRAPEEVLDQAEAYPFMTPIFGEGVVFDAPPERRREMLHNQALRDKFMRGHAATIADEVEAMVRRGRHRRGEGTIDLLDWFAELTIYTSSACLIGRKFRHELDRRFAELYHDLEQGTDAIAYVDPYAPIESFRRRDEARLGLVELVQGIMDRRRAGPAATDDDRDLLDVLMSIRDEDGTPRFCDRHGHRHVHLDDVRRPPHHLGHRGVDAHRAAAPSRTSSTRCGPSSTSSTRTAKR